MTEPLSMLPIPLLQWYQENARDLPWRREPTPYRVWVSEIMLQQTRVGAVLGYFARFMAALPTVQDLAAVPEDALMKLWQGIGVLQPGQEPAKAAPADREDHGGVSHGITKTFAPWPGWGTIRQQPVLHLLRPASRCLP